VKELQAGSAKTLDVEITSRNEKIIRPRNVFMVVMVASINHREAERPGGGDTN
jgi:hypothetical protein